MTARARRPGLGHVFYYKALGNYDFSEFKKTNFFSTVKLFDLMTEKAAAD